MSITVNKTNDGTVRRMVLAGATTGTLVALHKAGKINTQAADAFIKKMGDAVKSGNKETLKEGGKTILDGVKGFGEKIIKAGKEFWAKDSGTKGKIIKDKAGSLWEGAKGVAKKVINAGKDFLAKDATAKKEVVKNILKNPSTKYIAGITAGFAALGLIMKAIKNHKNEA